MANWYYSDEKGKKIGPVESSMLKTLVHVGVIKPETILENESGTRYQAFKVKEFGLERPKEPTPPPPTLTPSQKKLHGGVWHHRIRETPIAVIDFETTGLTAGFDRVVEVSVGLRDFLPSRDLPAHATFRVACTDRAFRYQQAALPGQDACSPFRQLRDGLLHVDLLHVDVQFRRQFRRGMSHELLHRRERHARFGQHRAERAA